MIVAGAVVEPWTTSGSGAIDINLSSGASAGASAAGAASSGAKAAGASDNAAANNAVASGA